MFEFPWTRKRREAEKAEADRLAKLDREVQERRDAQILLDKKYRSQLQAQYRAAEVGKANISLIKPVSGLTAQQAAQDDKRKREDDHKTSTSDNSGINAVMATSFYDSTSDCHSSDSGGCSGGTD
jgi:hypothetical protein